MKDLPARPIDREERKEILIESLIACREKDCADLFLEVEERIKERGLKPDYETVEKILNDE